MNQFWKLKDDNTCLRIWIIDRKLFFELFYNIIIFYYIDIMSVLEIYISLKILSRNNLRYIIQLYQNKKIFPNEKFI